MSTNYIFPLPFPVHIGFCIIGLLFFIIQYNRKKYIYQLLLAIAIPSTLLVYICRSDTAFMIFGLEELILFILIMVSIFITKKRLAKEEKEAMKSLDKNSEADNENSNSWPKNFN